MRKVLLQPQHLLHSVASTALASSFQVLTALTTETQATQAHLQMVITLVVTHLVQMFVRFQVK